jgi:hypothetical protein
MEVVVVLFMDSPTSFLFNGTTGRQRSLFPLKATIKGEGESGGKGGSVGQK